MAKVHLFPLITNLYSDTRLPLQYPGNSITPAASQVELAVLLDWIESNITLPVSTSVVVTSPTYTAAIPAGKWLVGVAVSSASAQTLDIGLSAGTDELVMEGNVDAGGVSTFGALLYGGASGTNVYFSNLTGTTTLTLLLL